MYTLLPWMTQAAHGQLDPNPPSPPAPARHQSQLSTAYNLHDVCIVYTVCMGALCTMYHMYTLLYQHIFTHTTTLVCLLIHICTLYNTYVCSSNILLFYDIAYSCVVYTAMHYMTLIRKHIIMWHNKLPEKYFICILFH